MTLTLDEAFRLAVEHHLAGKLQDAEQLYRLILQADPRHANSHHNLGVLTEQAGDPQAALEHFRIAMADNPRQEPYRTSYLNAMLRHGPNDPETRLATGRLLQEAGRSSEAEACYREALRLQPECHEACERLADIAFQQQRFDDAREAFQQALRIMPDLASVHLGLGTILHMQKRYAEAEERYRRSLAIDPHGIAALGNLGVLLASSRRFQEAEATYREALRIQATDYIYNHLGNLLKELGRHAEAEEAYRQALCLNAECAAACYNLGVLLREQGRYDEAEAAYREALRMQPQSILALVDLCHMRRHLCAWSGLREQEAEVLDLLRHHKLGTMPFTLLAMPAATARDQLDCARLFAAEYMTTDTFPHDGMRSGAAERLRIGYLSADFHDHPTTYLITELLRHHDRKNFEIFAYSLGKDDGKDGRKKIINNTDHFVDLLPMSDRDAAQRIHDDDIHILLDVKGYTNGSRPGILARRPAPVQVNYLAYPGTMGATFIDYLIADRFILPPRHLKYYDEAVIYLPDCYQPNDGQRRIAAFPNDRNACGLPENAFVFCCFNNTYKITETFFSIWMRLLQAVPESVLWLLETNPSAKKNLQQEATMRGVPPDRLIFAPLLPNEQHLARYRLADLFLDTLPYNAHTGASDALWAGLPVLTCGGHTFAGRVAASLLHAVGLPELITKDLQDYEATALHLATTPTRLQKIHKSLRENPQKYPLFDTRSYTTHLETAYCHIVQKWRDGHTPKSFHVNLIIKKQNTPAKG
ncbi:MAG: tetratricopeptide repeat protein [Magnetococcales bacterium]|nr:tetratricopeptide repeat protein [Magnetococcales bacterium]